VDSIDEKITRGKKFRATVPLSGRSNINGAYFCETRQPFTNTFLVKKSEAMGELSDEKQG
jgi:hypothetical protein